MIDLQIMIFYDDFTVIGLNDMSQYSPITE